MEENPRTFGNVSFQMKNEETQRIYAQANNILVKIAGSMNQPVVWKPTVLRAKQIREKMR